jgi:hypothetical protein
MPVPFPTDATVNLEAPDAEEVEILGRGFIGAISPPGGPTELQRLLIEAIAKSMTSHAVQVAALEPLGPQDFAAALSRRDEAFRSRIVQVMVLCSLILVPLPEEVATRVARYAAELGVDEGMLQVARRYAQGNLGLALIDFERNGYTADWAPERAAHLHTSRSLDEAWQQVSDDPALAGRWMGLEHSPPGTLGRRVWEFYRCRGFAFPGQPNSAPPYLAQHDWVHVVANYGTKVENELEVFTLIGRAIPDPRGFSLVAMVVNLFETGYLRSGAGLFQYDTKHLSGASDYDSEAMSARIADAMYRGARCGRDLLAVDWFTYADVPVRAVQEELGIPDKSVVARGFGSRGPWEPGGISPYQLDCGRRLAAAEDRPYDAYGALDE